MKVEEWSLPPPLKNSGSPQVNSPPQQIQNLPASPVAHFMKFARNPMMEGPAMINLCSP